MICIFGHLGNMGRRYSAILDHLRIEWFGVDAGGEWKPADAYIIATPTPTHAEMILWMGHLGNPILCEKPISKNLVELEKVLHHCEKHNTKLQMVSQYDYLIKPQSSGQTVYDYFKHGGDGLYWDCINIIHHSKSEPIIREKSPVWTCVINGHQLNLGDMDRAYIDMIQDWISNPRSDIDRIWDSHEKTRNMEAKCLKS